MYLAYSRTRASALALVLALVSALALAMVSALILVSALASTLALVLALAPALALASALALALASALRLASALALVSLASALASGYLKFWWNFRFFTLLSTQIIIKQILFSFLYFLHVFDAEQGTETKVEPCRSL